jgi:hypothetical protein
MLKNPVYRAICVYSDNATGEIRVQIPVLSGLTDVVPISYVGRTAYNGVWAVPSIGSQIVVTADDDNLTNVFWVQVAPDPATSLVAVQSQLDTISNDLSSVSSNLATTTGNSASNNINIASLTTRVLELESLKDASFLGVFR